MTFSHPEFTRITFNPDICFGKACIREMRMPVSSVLDYLAGGMNIQDLLIEFPWLEEEDVYEALAFSALLAHDAFIPLRKAS